MSTPMAKKSEAFKFEEFPDEIILKVMSYLDSDNRFNCFLTSKRLRAISEDHTLPSMWEKIHFYNLNFLFETLKNPKEKIVKDLRELNQEKYMQQSTWKHALLYNMWPCKSSGTPYAYGRNPCWQMNPDVPQKRISYLNLNIDNYNEESIQEILNKGCNYLMMSNIFPRVGCRMLSRISKKKELTELKEVQFDWCVLDDTGKESSQHFHPCYSLLKDRYETSIFYPPTVAAILFNILDEKT